MAKVMNQTSAVRMVYELPGATPGKTVRKSKTFANIKITLSDDVILAFGQKSIEIASLFRKNSKTGCQRIDE